MLDRSSSRLSSLEEEAAGLQNGRREELSVQQQQLHFKFSEPLSAVSAVAATSDKVLHNVGRSARQALAGVCKTLSTREKPSSEHRDDTSAWPPESTAAHRDDLGVRLAEPSVHADIAAHDEQMGARLSRVRSTLDSSTMSVDSDLDSDTGSEGDLREFWSLDAVSGDYVTAELQQLCVYGELSGEVVYLSSSHFDSGSSIAGVEDGSAEPSTRERLRKSLRLRPSIVAAWDVTVQQSILNEVCCLSDKCMDDVSVQ
jgi:hypothetical protein